nr:hypothetical protein B0A51_04521 [Rachicladosporium sp. CCFEE 5018]
MSSTTAHPRRRPARSSSPSLTPSLIDCFQNMNIRKGDTFHVPHNIGKDVWDPLESGSSTSPSMPGRSSTCPHSLEQLLIGSGERRVADLLARVDKAVATQSKLALGTFLSEPEVLPVPTFLVDNTNVQEGELIKTAERHHRHSHSSDSGIGSSVADSESLYSTSPQTAFLDTEVGQDHMTSATSERGLSQYAKDQIHRHIIQPILQEQTLREFHGLIKDVPNRIGSKEIKNLRDLEKTLIFLAPVSDDDRQCLECAFAYWCSGVKDYSRSPSAYLRFCERTVRVLHTTVTTLHESDQKAPTERPYTQGYFFDLVEQIRRYATILAATREKQAKGEKLDAMDYTPDESLTLEGGMTQNGKPAELIRHKDGKAISITSGRLLSEEEMASNSMKRPISLDYDDDDDDVLRSMARRKKGAKPEIHGCPQCDKEFKRPCDLTKHIKTHERPWKCSEEDCKYYEYGWPTEKERDRHVNDKHASTPSLYHCLYKPCPYTSKRESNCKQHMEKAHNWTYVRSKNNGKGRALDVTRLPQGSMPASPASAMMTPLTPIAPSPSVSAQSWVSSSRNGSMAPPPSLPSHYGTPIFTHPSPSFANHFNMNFDFNDMEKFPTTPALSDDRHGSSASSSSGLMLDGAGYDDHMSPEDFTFPSDAFSFNDFSWQEQSSANVPIGCGYATHAHPINTQIAGSSGQASAGARPDLAFTTPDIYDDMSMDPMDTNFGGPGADFTLFSNTSSAPPMSSAGQMIPSLTPGGTWGNFGGQFEYAAEAAPRMPTDSSALKELFPELAEN